MAVTSTALSGTLWMTASAANSTSTLQPSITPVSYVIVCVWWRLLSFDHSPLRLLPTHLRLPGWAGL